MVYAGRGGMCEFVRFGPGSLRMNSRQHGTKSTFVDWERSQCGGRFKVDNWEVQKGIIAKTRKGEGAKGR